MHSRASSGAALNASNGTCPRAGTTLGEAGEAVAAHDEFRRCDGRVIARRASQARDLDAEIGDRLLDDLGHCAGAAHQDDVLNIGFSQIAGNVPTKDAGFGQQDRMAAPRREGAGDESISEHSAAGHDRGPAVPVHVAGCAEPSRRGNRGRVLVRTGDALDGDAERFEFGHHRGPDAVGVAVSADEHSQRDAGALQEPRGIRS